MVNFLPEGISDIIQRELKKIDLVSKEDVQNLIRSKFSSDILIDKEEFSKLVSDSISELNVSLRGMGMTRNALKEDAQASFLAQERGIENQSAKTASKNAKQRYKKKNKFKKFKAKKRKETFNDKRKKKVAVEKKPEAKNEEIKSDSPVANFLRMKKPKDKMQELKCLAYYLDQIEGYQTYNIQDFHEIYKKAKIKVPPVFDTLMRFLVKSEFLVVSDKKKDGFTSWKITDKVLKEMA